MKKIAKIYVENHSIRARGDLDNKNSMWGAGVSGKWELFPRFSCVSISRKWNLTDRRTD